ncbi:hypothetical protein [Streptomyces sp. NBC_01727]|uniref:hypothetical protein n=1 Tax=Streptomyces sp. NBC_01727 TaxID=2975924 RepID=UPI002E129B11|nr:hypothetical protein OIE76_43595 [Streptomyces sp. NBC_01727]
MTAPAGGTCRLFVRATAGSKSAARAGRRCGAASEHTTVAELVEIGKTNARQDIEEVCLGSADTGRGRIRAGAQGSTDGHARHHMD